MKTTINYHLTNRCNFHCRFCFAHFSNVNGALHDKEQQQLVRELCKVKKGVRINFVGGEPTIHHNLHKLLKIAKTNGAQTSVTTNGSRINRDWICKVSQYLDMLTISIDSINDGTNQMIGRCNPKGEVCTKEHYYALADACHEFGITLKINTVVSRYNAHEQLASFINEMKPIRWKVFQALTVEGENECNWCDYAVDKATFDSYVSRQQSMLHSSDIELVAEDNNLMSGSYLMVNPEGCFFDNSKGYYTVSSPILKVGYQNARKQIHFDPEKYLQRKGDYSITRQNTTVGIFTKSPHFTQRQKERGISDSQVAEILSDRKEYYQTNGIYIVGHAMMKKLGLHKKGSNLAIVFDGIKLVTIFVIKDLFEFCQSKKGVLKVLL